MSTRYKRWRGTRWGLRRGDFDQFVVVFSDGTIAFRYRDEKGDVHSSAIMDRRTARLLARRINQALEATSQ